MASVPLQEQKRQSVKGKKKRQTTTCMYGKMGHYVGIGGRTASGEGREGRGEGGGEGDLSEASLPVCSCGIEVAKTLQYILS